MVGLLFSLRGSHACYYAVSLSVWEAALALCLLRDTKDELDYEACVPAMSWPLRVSQDMA